MNRILSAAAAGLLFGIGLVLSGMTLPSKVLGFLDIFGAWDPSLALVMVGAIGVHAVGWQVLKRRGAPLFDETFHLPTRTRIDASLLAGAAIFGVGWGLAGYCPGPAIVSAASGATTTLVFLASMIGGMVLFRFARPLA